MRKQIVSVAIAATALSGALGVRAQGGGDAKALEIVAQARKALGGEKKIASLTSLSLKAEYRREPTAMVGGGGGPATFVMMGGPGGGGPGGGQMTGEIEIDVAFPDKYFRQDTGLSGMPMTRIEGYEGERPFADVIANGPGMRVQVDRPSASDPERLKAALRRSRGELARLLLGLLAGTQPGFEVTYTYAGVAESPDGKAHMIDVQGEGDFKARLFIDTTTNQPLMLTYTEAEPRVARMMTRGGPGGGSAPATTAITPHGGATTQAAALTPEQRAEIDKQMKEAEATAPKMVERRVYFADYQDVDGVSLPHRITRGTAEKLLEEWEIKSYKVNHAIKPERFKVGTD